MRVLLIDDHPLIRKNLRQLLELRTQFEIVGEGSNGEEAVAAVNRLRPDVVLMDMNMPVMNGVDATRAIRETHPDIKILALTAFGEMPLVAAMVKAGAAGYILKGGSANELIDSIEAVARGQGALDKEVTRGVMDDLYREEQDRANGLAELDRMKSEFVSIVSHELRTPLTSISGGAATLQRSWDQMDESLRTEFFDSILKQCDNLAGMIEKILTVSGIRHGSLGLRTDVFSLGLVALEAVEMAAVKSGGRSVHVDLGEAIATGDRVRVRDVAHTLIENALDFTSGDVFVSVFSEEGSPRLEVRDEGPGIEQGKLQQLLTEPFVQGDSSHTRRVGGMGLSLYIARRVLEASKGSMEIETGPERGSVFTMILPAA